MQVLQIINGAFLHVRGLTSATSMCGEWPHTCMTVESKLLLGVRCQLFFQTEHQNV